MTGSAEHRLVNAGFDGRRHPALVRQHPGKVFLFVPICPSGAILHQSKKSFRAH